MQKLFCRLIPLIIFSLFFLSLKGHANAPSQYLYNDPNYLLSYAHTPYLEYVDLTSCTYNNEGTEYDTYATGYVTYNMETNFSTSSYATRIFRQVKDQSQTPQVFENNEWVPLPSYNNTEIQEYIKQHSYAEYINHYRPYAYYMFKIIYKQVHGTDYLAQLKGSAS